MPLLGLGPYVAGLGDGAPGTLSLPGTGFSVPAGLEAILEYNGLLMNVQRNIDRYKITNIDGLGDADIRDTRDVNTDDDGETPFNAFLGGRTIVIGGTIETYSVYKLRDMQQALRQAFADISIERPLKFRLGDFNKDHFIMCKKIGSISIAEAQQNKRMTRDFQITLRASNPRFLSYYQKSLNASTSSSASPVLIFTASNRGNYKAQTVTRIYGPSASTTITNGATNEQFTVTNIPTNGYFEFNGSSKTLKDEFGVNQWNNLQDDSKYLLLAPGANQIFYQGDASAIVMSWYDSWV